MKENRLILGKAVTVLALLICQVTCVDRNNFKTCEQSSFCRRCRGVKPGQSPYHLELNTLVADTSSISAQLVNTKNFARFKFQLFSLKDNTFRMKITEWSPIRPRFEVDNALVGEPALEVLKLVEQTAEHVVVQAGPSRAKVFTSPFRVDLFSGEQLVASANARGLFKFEHYRPKPADKPEGEEGEAVEGADLPDEPAPDEDIASDPGAWEENFKSHHDTKPFGPSAVALDVSFPGAHHAYGVPEHADSFALKSTKGSDPYRLYNLDVFEYELWNGMALYGSVPFLVAHGPRQTAGLFWMNAAETWVDVLGPSDQNVVSSIVNFVSGSAPAPQVDVHFMSESGVVDAFFLLGPGPKDVSRQYAALTGSAPLPQYFALGYHQSRWNYNDQDDVRTVEGKFDEYDLPLDVMWLDIEHTDSKKYFTWDPLRFSQPTEMTQNLTAKGRKLVVIVDPHIKRDPGYFLHSELDSRGLYVLTREGKVFEGWCWPGSSSYPDLLNRAVREYFTARYLLENYPGSTQDTYIWNDMNEPSVFSGPEVTMNKDCVHHGGWEHRDVHNVYGLYYSMATYEGLLQRSERRLRPFALTRAFFAGSQRYAAVWTGDNMAEWGHLRASVPMCLSIALAGVSFCGADVGGFFRNPEPELLVRWYQAAAYQPFFRSHSHIDTKRREPWLFDDQTLRLVRGALRRRYALLPLWYTLFREHELTGEPVMRPLWAEFPSEAATFAIDDEYLLGDRLLVHPVMEAKASAVSVYLPGPGQLWYDCDSHRRLEGGNSQQVPVSLDKVPVFQRGGTVVPRRERVRRSSVLGPDDPYTLLVALDRNGTAQGTLYIDDGRSFDYRQGKYLYLAFSLEGNTFSSRILDSEAHYPSRAWVERVVFIGWQTPVAKATVESKGLGARSLEVTHHSDTQVLVVRKPAVSVAEEWALRLE